jgi:hypothetical protein
MRKILVLIGVLVTSSAYAQSFEAGVHLADAQWSEFDGHDIGVGGRFTLRPLPLIGVEAEVSWYPSGFPPNTAAQFSGSRFEGMFGVTAGPTIGRIRPFAKAAGGFVTRRASVAAFACIAIYPPPLACLLAGGGTQAAYEIGGGLQVNTPAATFVRADVTDRILKYPGPSFRGPGLAHVENDDFFGGGLKFTFGAGIRF